MTEDLRCCGSGTCIIDCDGRCWCGQQWDGQTMCRGPLALAADHAEKDPSPSARITAGIIRPAPKN
ncbi:MAG: hypothetical protein Q8L65_14015 [Burkholderiales bacterium]|nr:hypothetical protein [Burkholderiales bacterium]MDP2397855.1 hypothetical protein [Burkholderiales bacterium]